MKITQKVLLLFVSLLLLILPMVYSAEYCYQETANESTSCGGLSTGSYSYTGVWYYGVTDQYLRDGCWIGDSCGLSTWDGCSSGSCYHYENYVVPQGNDINKTYIQHQFWDTNYPIINYSIPHACQDDIINSGMLQFRVGVPSGFNTLECKDGSGWYQITQYVHSFSDRIIEEGVWWYLSAVNNNPSANWEYQTPANLLTTNEENVTFYFNLTDDFFNTTTTQCALFSEAGKQDNNTYSVSGIYNLTTINIPEGQHTYFINCTDEYGLYDETSIKTIEADYTKPTLNVFSPSIDNSSVFYTFLNVSFYTEDINLARYIINVTNSTGALLYNELTNVTPSNVSVELLINSTSWNDGVYDIQIGVADE